MSDLLTRDDLDFWSNEILYDPFFKINPQLKTDLEALCDQQEEVILGRIAVRSYIVQMNNEKIPGYAIITNKRLIIYRVKGTGGFMMKTMRDKMLGKLNDLAPIDIGDYIAKGANYLEKNKVARKELELYVRINEMNDEAVLNNEAGWKVIYESDWQSLKDNIKEVTMGGIAFHKGTKVQYKPLKEKFFSKPKYPIVSFTDEALETALLEWMALFIDYFKMHGVIFKVNPEPAYAFQIVPE